jgi:uncharacterized protein (TIGR00369 family)
MRSHLTRHSRFGEWLGTAVVNIDAEQRSIEVHYQPREEAMNRFGTLAGGALAAMLDSLTGLAALASLPEGASAVHRALAVDYLRPAAPGAIRGIGRAIARDGDTVRSEGELLDADDRVLARARAELRVLDQGGNG